MRLGVGGMPGRPHGGRVRGGDDLGIDEDGSRVISEVSSSGCLAAWLSFFFLSFSSSTLFVSFLPNSEMKLYLPLFIIRSYIARPCGFISCDCVPRCIACHGSSSRS